MVMGVWMAVFLVGLLHYVIGIGETVFIRESLQDGADAGAYAAAVVYAQTMSFVVIMNIAVVTLVSISVALDMLASAAMACAGRSGAGICCSVVIALGLARPPETNGPDDPGLCGTTGHYRYYELQAELTESIDAASRVPLYFESGDVYEAASRRAREAAARNVPGARSELARAGWPVRGRATGPSRTLCTFLYDARLSDGVFAEVGVPSDPYSYPTRYDDCIAAASRATDVPETLLRAVVRQESGFDATKVSPSGAIGLMQLTPENARYLGVDPRDPCENVMGGARLLARSHAMLGEWWKAIAAYNGGMSYRRGPYGAPLEYETRQYVPSVMGFWQSQRDPDDRGRCDGRSERARPIELHSDTRMGSEVFQLRFVISVGERGPGAERGVAIPERLSGTSTDRRPPPAVSYDDSFATAQAEYFTDEPLDSAAMYRTRWQPRLRLFDTPAGDPQARFLEAASRAGLDRRDAERGTRGLILH